MALTDSPSSGQSEVLTELKSRGNNYPFGQLCDGVGRNWGYDGTTLAAYPAVVATVLSALQTAGYVSATTENGSSVVDLTSGTPALTARISLTLAGKAYARHPRPRTKFDPWGRGG